MLFPIQQGYGLFSLSSELTEEEVIELYKLKQIDNAEQTRNELFVLLDQQNPYFDALPNDMITFEEKNEEKSFETLDRRDQNFQVMKDEQISIAEKKYKEILGGKIILNSFNNELVNKKHIHGFKIDNQTGFMKRSSEDFQNYRLLQISIAEDIRDNNLKVNNWNPYNHQKNESVRGLSNNEENKNFSRYLDNRQSEEFKNLITTQISLAENIRNAMLDVRITNSPNPYLDERIDESSSKNNTNIIIIGWSDPTYVTDESDFNITDRDAEGFEMVKSFEIEIAQNRLNEILLLSDSEEDYVESVISTNDKKKPAIFDRDDLAFEFVKNRQTDKAENKLMEILGGKNIQNSDY